MKYRKILSFVCLLALMTGCGFHLRGKFPIPECFRTLRVTPEQSFDSFQQALRKTLAVNGVKVICTNNPDACNVATLTIVSQTLTERTVAYGSDVQASRAMMQLEVIYQLRDAAGTIIIDNTKLKIEREFQINPNAILGTENERDHVRVEIYLDGASQLIRQLSVALERI